VSEILSSIRANIEQFLLCLLVLLRSIGGDENGSNGENRNSALGREQRHTTLKV
jgi:hypothetical protein